MTTTRMPVFLDCDTGIDDTMALGYLLATTTIDLVGIGSVSGNVSAAQGAKNTLDLLTLAGRTDIPVAIGAADFERGGFRGDGFQGGATHVHGANGIGDVELATATVQPVDVTAPELLVEMARRYAGELHLIAIGPLTNIAAALRLEPNLTSLVKEITLMGGAAMVPGNIGPISEANIANDPEAAAQVFAADWPITMVPLDVTITNRLEEDDRLQLIDSERPVAVAIGHILDFYFEFYRGTYGERAAALHDPLAAAIAVGDVSIRTAPVVRVVIDDSDGPGRGQTICDLRGRLNGYPAQEGAHCRVVLELHHDFAPALMTRLLEL